MTRSSLASTYDDDFFAWTQEQAAALLRLPREIVGGDLDVPHLAEEIEDLGKRDLHEVTSLLTRFFEHLMKIASFPDSRDVAHWSAETHLFRDGAVDAFSPSMRQAVDVALIWNRSRRRQSAYAAKLGASLNAPVECPFALQDLLEEDFDLDAALAKVAIGDGPQPDARR